MQAPAAAGGVFVSVPFGRLGDTIRNVGRFGHVPGRTRAGAVEYSPKEGDRFVEALSKEIAARAAEFAGRTFNTVYFGGCGPSALSLDQLYRVLQVLYDSVSIVPVEQTLVVLPGTVDPYRAKVLFESGFDRMELRMADAAGEAGHFATLREAGFRSVGLDVPLVSDAALGLEPDHLVLAAPPASPLPSEFREYLPNHFCRPGHECRYLADFESGADCVGFGPGAVARSKGAVVQNESRYDAWLKAARSGKPATRSV